MNAEIAYGAGVIAIMVIIVSVLVVAAIALHRRNQR
jgi:hypothetical protein